MHFILKIRISEKCINSTTHTIIQINIYLYITRSNCLIQFEPDQFNDWFCVFSFHFHQTFLLNLSCSHQTVKVTATGALSRPSLTA